MSQASRKRHSLPNWIESGLSRLAVLALLLCAPAAAGTASAVDIQRVVSPGGIEAWLVESRQVPLIAMRFGFQGGSTQDPEGKAGLAYFVSGMLDEGAGDLKSQEFQERLEDDAVKLSFDASRDYFSGSLQTLTKNMDKAFELTRLALNEARFDAEPIQRIKGQILAGLAFDQKDPQKVAAREWYKLAFPDHVYARQVKGTTDAVRGLGADDMKAFVKNVFARDTLKVAVVGDIDAKTLGEVLDRVFGSLPAKANLVTIPEAKAPTGPRQLVTEMNVPQAVAQFGHSGVKRKDPDFVAAYVMNYILGGGGFASRLTEEVREKRGLAYSVYSYLLPYRYASVYAGNVATENKSIAKSISVIQQELERMAVDGPSEEDLKNAKQYLTGSYALRFDTSSKIAGQLLWIQIEDLGIDYVEKRNSLIEAVTLDDLKRVAKRILQADGLIVSIVGKPTKKAVDG